MVARRRDRFAAAGNPGCNRGPDISYRHQDVVAKHCTGFAAPSLTTGRGEHDNRTR